VVSGTTCSLLRCLLAASLLTIWTLAKTLLQLGYV